MSEELENKKRIVVQGFEDELDTGEFVSVKASVQSNIDIVNNQFQIVDPLNVITSPTTSPTRTLPPEPFNLAKELSILKATYGHIDDDARLPDNNNNNNNNRKNNNNNKKPRSPRSSRTPSLTSSPQFSDSDLPPLPIPTPSRAFKRRTIKPLPKGILKPPTAPVSRFSFRRDILQPFNSRLVYSAYGTPSTTTTTAITSQSTSTSNGGASNTNGGIVNGVLSNGSGASTNISITPVAVAVVGNAAAAAGGFWGNAMKKLSVVTTAATASISEVTGGASSSSDRPSSTPHRRSTTGESIPSHSSSSSAITPSNHLAPNMPSPGLPTSSLPSSSPYATIHSSSTSTTLSSGSSATIPPIIATPTLSVTELKKVRFRMASLKVIYPINGPNGPLAPWEEGKTKKRINEEYRASQQKSLQGGESKGWTGEALGKLYAECCRTREEPGIERVRRAFRENPDTPPKVFDLSNELLSVGAIEAFSDLLSVDFGVKKVVLESCGLDDESLKPLLHALLVSASIPTLSLANNKRIKAKGWKMIAIFVRKARFLRYLDVSENTIDKRAAEYLVQAITPSTSTPSSSSPASQSLLSLSTNSINNSSSPPISTSELAPIQSSSMEELTKKDEIPIVVAPGGGENEREEAKETENPFYDGGDDDDLGPLFTVAPLLKEDPTSEVGTVLSLRMENCSLKSQALEILAHGVRSSGLKHISIRRNRISPLGSVALAIMIRDYPVSTDQSESFNTPASPSIPTSPLISRSQPAFEPGNSITARQTLQTPYVKKSTGGGLLINLPNDSDKDTVNENTEGLSATALAAEREREAWKNSEARNKLMRQIDELPRTGSLLTLDIKGNDIRNGVVYISQVLKRNRTLKVLNLSENKIDVQGLVSIAEALKYNSTLETLDMSLNPCCGPSLEGITSLRAAITINSNLKRVFLNSTDLSSEGAIALAEFLPEAKSLIHLDLTGNFDIDIAGVMALAVSVKMNRTLRCLDLNIPPNDPDFARLSQEILQCCINNTESAQEESLARGSKGTITAPILKSVVARDLKTRQEQEERRARQNAAASRTKDEIFSASEECLVVLNECLLQDEMASQKGIIVSASEVVKDLLLQAELASIQLAEILAVRTGDQKAKATALSNQLTATLDRAKILYNPITSRPSKSSVSTPSPASPNPRSVITKSKSYRAELDSPSFSITDSDDSEDSEDESSTKITSNKILPSTPPPSATLTKPLSIKMPDSLSVIETDNSSPLSVSPLEHQSRNLTLEEGEIFRKGAVAIDVEDEDLDVSGEELRKEILETEVVRSPVRRLSFDSETLNI